VTWGASGPTAARVAGESISVGFTPDAITDATTWAPSSAAGVIVELPTRVPTYWQARVAAEQPGSPAWRHAQRQRMASLAALQDRPALYRAYDGLRQHGGVELGDLALASGGIATATTDKQFAEALAPATIERTPHIAVDGEEPIAVGERIGLRVWLDTEALRAGEESAGAIVLPALERLELRASLIASEHFAVVGDATSTVIVRSAEERSTEARFVVECVREAEGEAGVTVTFTYGIRPAGAVWRTLQVAGRPAAVRQAREEEPEIRVDARAAEPDLVVEVVPDPDGDERHFVMTVTAPRLSDFRDGVTDRWRLPSVTREIVADSFDAFMTSAPTGRVAALRGAGMDLFDTTPEPFRDAVRQLAALPEPEVKSIFVVTAEPYVPWELMVRDDGDAPTALGVEFAVGRWVDPRHAAPAQAMPIVDSYVIAPAYRGSKKLAFSAAEADYVVAAFDGERIAPALLSTIDGALAQRGVTLLHLVCHGHNAAGGQILDLDPDEQLKEVMLRGLPGVAKGVGAAKPFVFLNACEVGQVTPALVGTGGFASRFIALGARCVIAPIWSVDDAVASQVSRLFYDAVRAAPALPFAAIMREIRRRAYEGENPEDSYAAYCFFGDPLAAQVTA
jgi:hypothetical protein